MMWKTAQVFGRKNKIVLGNRLSSLQTRDFFLLPSLKKVKKISSNYSVSASSKYSLQENVEIEGFLIKRVDKINENSRAVFLTHLETGAHYLHVEKADPNNVFGVGFKTITTNSTGLPHILEHTTLCGSAKYPCRDPFFKMLNRSMATFMNAMTGPDFTVYPFSTQNLQDYKNLMSVYLDAVFSPLLNKTDFLQEGWRLEHEDVHDKESPIVVKGVVLNEMKGVFSDSQSVFSQDLINSILPSHTYGHIWGGDPLAIPSLKHEDLVKYHKKYYNPSNAMFFSYGNFPLIYNLSYLNQNYLTAKNCELSPSPEVPLEKRWSSPVSKHISCRFDPLAPDREKQSTIAIGCLFSDVTDIQETFELTVLSTLLLCGANTVFYKNLIEPGIGSGFAPVTGYEMQTRDTVFCVGLQGVKETDFDRITDIFHSSIDETISKGFDENHIEAVLHEIELNNKIEGDNYGINLLMKLMPVLNHRGDLITALRQDEQVATLRYKLKDNAQYLRDKVIHYLQAEPHKLILTMSPEEGYEDKLLHEEEMLIKNKVSDLTPSEKEQIFLQGIQLQKLQEAAKNVNVLPTLTISDVSKDVDKILYDQSVSTKIPLYVYIQPTNEVTHLRAVFNSNHLDKNIKRLIPLFCSVAANMGTKKHSFKEFEQMIRMKTGGFSFSSHIAEDADNNLKYEEGIILNACSLDRNVKEMYSLLCELLTQMSLKDMKRFETLLSQIAVSALNNIFHSGHHYAMSSSAALVSPVCEHVEDLTGLSYIQRLQDIVQKQKFSQTLSELEQLPHELIHASMSRAAVTLCDKNKVSTIKETEPFLNLFDKFNKGIRKTEVSHAIQTKSKAVHHIHSIPVNYISKSIFTVSYNEPQFASLRVLAKLLSNEYLHPIIRERGGAYGSGAIISPGGVFSFFSYRDPNTTATLDTFDAAEEWTRRNLFSDSNIEEAKLGVLQQLDMPIPPEQRGMRKFLYDIDDDEFESQRKLVMNVTREQILNVSQDFLKSENLCGKAIIGPKNDELKSRLAENWKFVNYEL